MTPWLHLTPEEVLRRWAQEYTRRTNPPSLTGRMDVIPSTSSGSGVYEGVVQLLKDVPPAALRVVLWRECGYAGAVVHSEAMPLDSGRVVEFTEQVAMRPSYRAIAIRLGMTEVGCRRLHKEALDQVAVNLGNLRGRAW